jgi:glycosyltransferase involved in cell wall biosynthesis
MKKIVSICIPTYNQTEYLKKCLESVLAQSYKDYELIISDDSPNDTIEQFLKTVLKDIQYSYTRNTPPLGMPENWNSAIKQAGGKYIKIMHHDDFFTSNDSLSLMVEEIEKQKGSFLFCQTDVWHVKSDMHHIHKISDKQFSILKKEPEFLFFKNMIGAPSTTLYINNKAFHYDKRFKWLVDIDFYMQYLFNSQKVIYLNKVLVSTAHDTEGQVTGSVIDDKDLQIREHVILFNKIKKYTNHSSNFASFFDYLFFKFQITSISELEKIVPEAVEHRTFFISVISDLPKYRMFKAFKKRFFESRYNNYIFKFEQFI